MKEAFFTLLLLLLVTSGCRRDGQKTNSEYSDAARELLALDWSTEWELVEAVDLQFETYHNQGMTRAGDNYFLSSVEVIRWPRRSGDGPDREVLDPGEGRGHLFKFDAGGRLLGQIRLDEGIAYHPGGIDYDGRWIWVPVTEYYPYSRTIVYRVDPETLEAEEVLRIDDSIGAIIRDTDNNRLIGANWGAREFLVWPLDADARPLRPDLPAEKLRTPNASYYVAAQDCQYLGGGLMLCAGYCTFFQNENPVRLGGLEVLSTVDLRPVHQLPILQMTPRGTIVTGNPTCVEAGDGCIMARFIPEDGNSTMYVYRSVTKHN